VSKQQAIAAVNAEPELPGEPPPAFELILRGIMEGQDLDALVNLLRNTVRLTKEGIRERIESIKP